MENVDFVLLEVSNRVNAVVRIVRVGACVKADHRDEIWSLHASERLGNTAQSTAVRNCACFSNKLLN